MRGCAGLSQVIRLGPPTRVKRFEGRPEPARVVVHRNITHTRIPTYSAFRARHDA
jgi:hypothetical protein